MIMTKEQYESISQWQKETFGQATAISKISHLKQEILELEEELKSIEDGSHSKTVLEFADCFILLFGAAASYGFHYDDIIECIETKMVINKNRVWGKPDENGVVNHIK